MTGQVVYERNVDDCTSVASVVSEFERQVDAGPSRDAVRRARSDATGSMSFAQLDMWANVIAWDLIGRRGTSSEPVPLAVCEPQLMLAAALGTLKAGKFYVAVNPMHPAPHIRRVLDELDAPVLLCDRRGEHAVGHAQSACSVEEILARGTRDERPGLQFDEDRLAYVLYTSGSTGRPRGVAQSRRDMLHNVARHRPLAVGREDCVTLISADGFVAAVSNPYVALLGGAGLAPYSFKERGVESMIDWLRACDVTVLYAFPSFLRQLAAGEDSDVYAGLRLVYLGGETVLPSDLRSARRLFPTAELSIGLNSSETGLTCLHLIPRDCALPDPVPVGHPVLDVEVAVLDERGTQLSSGESGEIEIRSKYVRPRLWAARAICDADDCAFRTGDSGRINADGIVFHLGRLDGMIKIRGFRVETAEVEAVISALEEVAEAAVFASGKDLSATELTACVVRAGTVAIDPVAVRSAVARELPPAMIPARIVVVDELPRTLNGKLDRKGLASTFGSLTNLDGPSARSTSLNGYESSQDLTVVSNRASVERRVVEIWSSVLEIEQVNVEDDFFALGGTSIKAVSVMAQVRREFRVQVPLAVLFETPTITALTDVVMELREERGLDESRARKTTVRLARQGDFPDICALVNHYIQNTTFNFRTQPQRLEEWVEEWSATRTEYPWLVAVVDDRLAGVAYAGPWKGRPAYDWCAEVTVYVAQEARCTGIGGALYSRLLQQLDDQGFTTEIAVITLPNDPSVAFHEACGFNSAGVLTEIGYKHGEWLDVGFWQRHGPKSEKTPQLPTAVVIEEW